jgi:hypothetical protein
MEDEEKDVKSYFMTGRERMMEVYREMTGLHSVAN